jgi:ubiquinone/menaquinone biosynthesis C-methylase UbiE
MSVINRQPNRLAIEALRLSETDNVLELGVGSGWALRRVVSLSQCRQIFGIDQSAEMLALSSRQTRSAVRCGRVLLVRAKFEALPFSDNCFDRLLAVNVVYFFSVHGEDFREARRVLRPGGRMVVYVSDRETLANFPFAREDTHRSFDQGELVAALRTGGFAESEITVVPVKLPLGVSGLLATAVKQP